MYIYTLSLGSRSSKRIRGFVVVDVSQRNAMFYIKQRSKTMLQSRTPFTFTSRDRIFGVVVVVGR